MFKEYMLCIFCIFNLCRRFSLSGQQLKRLKNLSKVNSLSKHFPSFKNDAKELEEEKAENKR